MSLMEWIRRKGHIMLLVFLVMFVVSLFFGLTIGGGGFSLNRADREQGNVTRVQPVLVNEGELQDVAMRVNGRPVPQQVFDDLIGRITQNMDAAGRNDPSMMLDAYGYVLDYVVNEEISLERAEELGIRLTDADFEKAEQDAATGFMTEEARTSGNVVGDLMGKLSDRRERNVAFRKYLEASGLGEDEWKRSIQRGLLIEKVREKLQEEADNAKKAEIEKTKAEIDTKLAAGEKFSELAREYSDGSSAASGGDLDWIGAGLLFDQKVTDEVFSTPVGEITGWLEIPAGWQRFEIYEKKSAEGAEFEKQKPELIKQVKAEHPDDPDYAPTDAELAKKYEQVRARAIELHTTDTGKVAEQFEEWISTAEVEVNNPYVLAYQALKDSKLQPPAGMDAAKLETIARNAAVGEGYDFSLIQQKLDADKKRLEEAKAEATQNDGAETAVDGEAAADAPEADAATDAAAEDAAAEEAEVKTPIYALGIGLLKNAIQNAGAGDTDHFPYYMIAKTYIDWLDDETNLPSQPVERDAARAEIEEKLARVVEMDNYSAVAFAYRGLNLARMDKKPEALEQLAKAEEYAPQQEGEVWTALRKAYEVLDDQTRIAAVDAKLAEFRNAQIQQYMQQQMAQQENQQAQADLQQQMAEQGIDFELPETEEREGAPATDAGDGDTATE
jgi:hypothetical protein